MMFFFVTCDVKWIKYKMETSAGKNNMLELSRTTPSLYCTCPEYNALVDVYQDLCYTLPINNLFPGLILLRIIDYLDKMKLCRPGQIEEEIAEEFMHLSILSPTTPLPGLLGD